VIESQRIWIVARTEPKRERAVLALLKDAGTDAYVPCETFRKVVRGRILDRANPVYRGCVFVFVEPRSEAFAFVRGILHVRGFLTLAGSSEGIPGRIPQDKIDWMREQEAGPWDGIARAKERKKAKKEKRRAAKLADLRAMLEEVEMEKIAEAA